MLSLEVARLRDLIHKPKYQVGGKEWSRRVFLEEPTDRERVNWHKINMRKFHLNTRFGGGQTLQYVTQNECGVSICADSPLQDSVLGNPI